MAINLKIKETNLSLKVKDSDALRFTAETGIPIYPEEYAGAYSVTPTESSQVLNTNGLMLTDDVTVGAIDSEYVGSDVPRRSSLNVDGLTVSAAAGYYEEEVSSTVSVPLQEKSRTIGASGTYEDVADSGYYGLSKVTNIVPNGSMSIAYDSNFYTSNSVRKWHIRGTANVNPKGWFNQGNNYGNYVVYDALESTTVTPTTSAQTVGGANMMMEGAVTVSAMPSGTAGTPTATKSAVSNHSVNVTPSVTNTSGYITGSTKTGTAVTVSASELVSGTYTVDSSGTKDVTNYASASVPSGTAGTPALTVSAVENHSKTIRASVINQTGWITGGTISGASTIVSASDLVSGSQNITANANNIDVTNLASVNVQVPSWTPTLQTKSKTYTPTTSQQTEQITADAGYDGLDEVNITVNAMPSGSVTSPATITGSSATVSTGTNTLTLSKTISVTPNVTTAGYISSGTAGNSNISLSATVQTKGASTYRASTTQQTVASGTYLTGALTIAPVSQTNLSAENIKDGTTISISDGANNIWSVTGTYSGGGGDYELLATQEFTVNTTSTTATSIGTITLSSGTDISGAIIYVRIRDKAGRRNGYFYGFDAWYEAFSNGSTAGRILHRTSTSGASETSAASNNGVYPNSLNFTGKTLQIYRKYSSSVSLTIDGTYKVEVYRLKYPDDISPFD